MPLYLQNGKLLVRDGALAAAQACCCGINCDTCDYDDYPNASATIAGIVSSATCCGNAFNGTFGLTAAAVPVGLDPFPDFDLAGGALPCEIPADQDCSWRWKGTFCDLLCEPESAFNIHVFLDLRVIGLVNGDWYGFMLLGRNTACGPDYNSYFSWGGYMDEPCGKTATFTLCDFGTGLGACAGSSTVEITLTP